MVAAASVRRVVLVFAVVLRRKPTPDACLSLPTHIPTTDPWPRLKPLCFCWHGPGLCCPPSLINLQSLKHRPSARHGPYIDEDRGTSHLKHFLRTSQVIDSRPASFHRYLPWYPSDTHSCPYLSRSSMCEYSTLLFTGVTSTKTARASSKTTSVITDQTPMPSIALWSHRFGRPGDHEHVFAASS